MNDCDRCDHPYLRHMPCRVVRINPETKREELTWPDGRLTTCRMRDCLCDMYVEHRGVPIGGESFRVPEEERG